MDDIHLRSYTYILQGRCHCFCVNYKMISGIQPNDFLTVHFPPSKAVYIVYKKYDLPPSNVSYGLAAHNKIEEMDIVR